MTEPTDDPLKAMSQVAALCSDLNIHAQALEIFERLVLLRDGHPNALVSLALAQSRAGDDRSAIATLRRALDADAAHDMARVMLAIHLHRAADPVARTLLRAVLADGSDEDAIALAVSVQDEVLSTALPAERTLRHRYTRVDAD